MSLLHFVARLAKQIAAQFAADVACRRRMCRQQVGKRFDFGKASGFDGFAEHLLGAALMLVGVEEEFAARYCQGIILWVPPTGGEWSEAHAGEDPRDFTDVGLAVTTAHPHGMQFQQLPGKVFVAAAGGIADVVQVHKHGRVAQYAEEHVAKAAPDMWPNRTVDVIGHRHANQAFLRGDIEMVEPEPDQSFRFGIRAVEAAPQGQIGIALHQFAARAIDLFLRQTTLVTRQPGTCGLFLAKPGDGRGVG
ncbi:MAG: hypothetical protein AW07_04765 [Candidatus Accumulibacter sp. SK-11]|nr:MAG: hypothetical protein AW07_04765 [Candidatus Accumulibacter sp. SK-11]